MNAKESREKLVEFASALILIIIISLWSVWPLVKRPYDSIPDDYDGLLITWIINQNIQKIPNNLGNIFQGNIFYPNKNTLALSEILISSSLMSYFPVKLTGYPLVAFNFSFVVSQILTLAVVLLWWREMAKNFWAALIAVIALGLSQIRFHYLAHLQMWTMQWWLISAWMIWRYTKNGKVWQLYLAGLFVILQVWESVLPIYWIILSGVLLFALNYKMFLKVFRHLLLISVFVLLFTLPVIKTYYSVSKDYNFKRTIRDAAHFSMAMEEPFTKFLSPGLYVLGVVGLYQILKSKDLTKNKDVIFLSLILIVSLMLAFGPVVKIDVSTFKIFGIPIPLPYAVLYYLVPGFSALRTPSRWIWPAALAFSGISALGLSKLKKYQGKVLLFLLFVGIVGGTKLGSVKKVATPDQYSSVYSWVKNQSEDVILELPIYTWADDNSKNEVYRMLYSLNHGKKLVNGYSGFFPVKWSELVSQIKKEFPSAKVENILINQGVDLIIVHKNELSKDKLDQIISWGGKKKVYEDNDDLVFKL